MKIRKKILSAILSLSMIAASFSGMGILAASQQDNLPYADMQSLAKKVADAASVETELVANTYEVTDAPATTEVPVTTETPVTVIPTITPSASPEITVSPQPTQAAMGIYNTDGTVVKVPAPYYYTKLSQLDNPKYNTYIVKVPLGYTKDVVIPIKVKSKGALIYALGAQYTDVDLSYYSLYSDAKCTKFISASENTAFVPKAGTYYIKVSRTYLSKAGDSYILAAFSFVSGADSVIKNKSKLVTCIVDYNTPYYYKMTVTKTTKLTFSITADYSVNATLCNNKKVAITNETYISSADTANKELTYVVPKGTYYLKMKSPRGFIGTSATFTTVSNAAGTSKAKAGTLKVNGKTRNILMLPAESTKHVYYMKVYNPKRQAIYLNVTSNFSSGKMQLEFIDSKGDSYGKKIIYDGIREKQSFYAYQTSYTSSSKTLPKGTYYIKFTKLDKKTSGMIQINIKNKK